MRNAALALFAFIDLAASIPYFVDIWKGKTKPNLSSWSTWTLLNAITVIAALMAGGALNTVMLAFSYFLSTLIIVILALYKGTRRYTLFDGVCQGLALIGIIAWLKTSNPNVALIFVIGVSEIIVLPTLRHAYKYPHEETPSTFLIASFAALGTLCLATQYSFAALAVPLDLVLGNGLLAGVILIRRRLSQKEA